MESCAVLQAACGDVAKKEETPTAEAAAAPASAAPFASHMAQLIVGAVQVTLRVLKMNGSTMILLSNTNAERMDEFAMAMPSRPPSTQIVSTTFLGESGQSDSVVLANKLAKRYGRQFYVSFNLQMDSVTHAQFEAALVNYMKQNLEMFV
ncbi:uncharacterized protein LOC111603454 [Drosophila hydei]|uniref:Uncharacterized protein LOC111603454 n=1 Tax=Drosophila hydei TaxID=7224 RepID=A0A6J1MC71_DROHY|nr:uncharacterized protein LOC111603454 [Drosophila hydei]